MNEHEAVMQAVEDVVYRYRLYRDAKTPLEQANRLTRLNDTIGDLTTWIKGYDYDTDTLPWERDEE